MFQRLTDYFHHGAAVNDATRRTKWVASGLLAFSGYSLFHKDHTLAGGAAFTAWGVSIFGWAHYRARLRQIKAEYQQRRDALPEHLKAIRDGNAGKGAFAVVTLVVGVRLFRMWNEQRKAKIKSVSPDGITPQDVEGQPGWFTYFTSCIGVKVEKSSESLSATTNQVCESLKKNTFSAVYNRADGTRTQCDIFFPRKSVALFPKHVFYTKCDMGTTPTSHLTVDVTRFTGKSGAKFTFSAELDYCGLDPELDLVACYVPNCPDLPNAGKWFPLSKPTGTSICRFMVNRDGTFDERRISVNHKRTGHKYQEFYGGSYDTTLARSGACMAPLVLDVQHPTIMGFHIGGNEKTNCGVMQTVTSAQLNGMIEKLQSKDGVMLSAQSCELPKEQYGRKLLVSDSVHPHCMASWLTDKDFVDVLGSTKLRTSQKSRVEPSVLSEAVAEHFDVPQQWGKPKLQPNWEGFNKTLEHIVNPADCFRHSEVERARQDWLEPLHTCMDAYVKEEDFRPLTLQENILGIPGKRFIDAIPMDTSMGFPIFGKKSKYFTEVRKGEKLVDRIPSKEIMQEVERMKVAWRKNERAYPVTSATLKDEPTKLDSEKVRVFQASAIALGMCIREYFLPVSRFLQLHPIESESAVGVNAFSKQWEELMNHAHKFDEEEVIAWDYSKYDVRMNSQITRAVWLSFIELAERGGYPTEALEIMKAMVVDIVHPLIDYNGTLILCYNLNTSGNNMTVNVNGGAGSLYVRVGFWHIYPLKKKFRDWVAALTYGDDFDGSVHRLARKFNFRAYQKFLKEHNMKVTLPNKSNDLVDFLDIEDTDFLKRKSNYIPEINRSIGKLDEMSIFKSLHANLDNGNMEETAVSCIETAMHEWFAHGREVYSKRQEQMRKVCAQVNLPVPAVEVSFDERVEKWLAKYD
jgi:hypothetical protein